MRVSITNTGQAPAGFTPTRVSFGNLGYADLPTGEIKQGAVVYIEAAIPDGCWDPNCDFTITADYGNILNEQNEADNIAQGFCTDKVKL